MTTTNVGRAQTRWWDPLPGETTIRVSAPDAGWATAGDAASLVPRFGHQVGAAATGTIRL